MRKSNPSLFIFVVSILMSGTGLVAIAQEANVPTNHAVVPLKTEPEELQGWSSVNSFTAQMSSERTPVELHFGKSKYIIPRNYLETVRKSSNNGRMSVFLDYLYPKMAVSKSNESVLFGKYDQNVIRVYVGDMGSVDVFNKKAVASVAEGRSNEERYGLLKSPDHTLILRVFDVYVDVRKPKQDSIVINCPNDSEPPPSLCSSDYEAPGGLHVKIQFDKRLLPGWKTIIDTVHTDLSKFYAGELP